MTGTTVALEMIKLVQGLAGPLLGGGLVILGSWISDRRKAATERDLIEQRERAVLTGMFAVRNHIAECVNVFEQEPDLFRLQSLATAQVYLHRLMDKAPGDSESLTIAMVDIGLHLDALLATVAALQSAAEKSAADVIAREIAARITTLLAAVEHYDVIAHGSLTMMSEEEMARFPGFAEAQQDEGEPNRL